MGKIVSSIFGGGSPKPPPPAAVAPIPEPTPVKEAPPPTPVADEQAIERRKKAAIASSRQRSGRSSTILSDSETLG